MYKYNLKEWWYDLSAEDRETLKKIVLDDMQMDLEEGELEEDRQGNTSNSNSTDEIIIEKIYKSTQQQSVPAKSLVLRHLRVPPSHLARVRGLKRDER